jgi:DNA polymerase-3 subunit gamma/tau
MVIVDEAHALSKAAFQSLLKIIEEPPPYLFFSFCTTEPEKVPKTIVTRCQSYLLKAVSRPDLTEYLETILDQEEDLADMPLDVLDVAVAHADGGVRQALVNLSMVRGVETAEKAAEVLSSAEQSTAAIDLCRILVSGKGGWSAAKAVIEKMADQNPESIRIVMVNYVSKVLMGSKSESDARRMLAILEEFQGPFNQSEKLGPVLLAVGRLLLA